MAVFLSCNFALTNLAAALTSSVTTITVTTGTGALFPSPTTGQFFSLTLNDALTGLVYEIVWVTSRTGDTMTVERGQEGTTAKPWLIGDFAYRALTAGEEQLIPQLGLNNVWTGNNEFSATGTAISAPNGLVDAATLTATGAVTGSEFVGSGSNTPILSQGFVSTRNPGNTAYIPLLCGQSSNLNAATIMSLFQSSLGTTGYKFIADQSSPTGYTLLQWETIATANGIAVGFPTAFPTECLAVALSEGAGNSSNWGSNAPTIHAASYVNNVEFQHWTLTWNGASWVNGTNTCTYFAIGY